MSKAVYFREYAKTNKEKTLSIIKMIDGEFYILCDDDGWALLMHDVKKTIISRFKPKDSKFCLRHIKEEELFMELI